MNRETPTLQRPQRPQRVWRGEAYPLGANFDGTGTNFAIFSEVAERVELCLFDSGGTETRFDLPESTAFTWHGYLPNVRPGQRYGYRVHGPWDPAAGIRCNPAKLLLDPYAKAVEGAVDWNPAVFGYPLGGEDPLAQEDTDSAAFVPRSVVVDPYFHWGHDRHPRTPWADTVVYELHVKGFTQSHPEIPEELRGTYAGLGSPEAIEYLLKLGVTAVELLPVHQFIHDDRLVQRNMRNYWGYNSIGYLAPHNEYSSRGQRGEQVQEFKQMVKDLHAAGLEVILDVVYNHTAEGNHLGPTLCFKGIDNPAYYRSAEDPAYYMDYTGTGNSLNMRHPNVLQLIMDSLRYWITEMHVDGFRFDLAAALARELHDVDRLSAFFDLIQQDPVIRQAKLIAEPWDVGEGGYQVGNFPPLWSEWNGEYRDTVRDFWRGEDQQLGRFAYRFTGSSDLYQANGRRPYNSINFITCHDGFTLADLVTYNEKHNGANGEENRDGENYNRSWNYGVEGPTDDPQIVALRTKQQRNFLTTLLLSQGVPMLLGGDEFGRTQGGNNNAYCQDNEISWLNWDLQAEQETLTEFTRRLIHLRRHHPVFRSRRWFHGQPVQGSADGDIGWFKPDGTRMSAADWDQGFAKAVAIYYNGISIPDPDPRGEPVEDDSFFVLLNAHDAPITFSMGATGMGDRWVVLVNTDDGTVEPRAGAPRGTDLEVPARSLILLRSAD